MDRERERQIIIEGRKRGLSDEFLKQAVIRDRERKSSQGVAGSVPQDFSTLPAKTGGASAETASKFTGGQFLAKGLGMALAAPSVQKNVDDIRANELEMNKRIAALIREKRARGEDTTKLENLIKTSSVGNALDTNFQAGLPTNKEVIGSAVRLGATAVLPTALGGVSGGVSRVLPNLGSGVIRGGIVGATTGAVEGGIQGAGLGLERNEDQAGILRTARNNALGGAALGGVLGGTVGGIGGVIARRNAARSPFESADEAFEAIRPKLTSTEIKEKAQSGLIDFDERGNYIQKMSAEERRLVETTKNLFTPKSSTGQKIGRVQKVISEVAENDVTPILRNSQANGGLDDVFSYIDQIQPTKQFAKNINPTAYRAFGTVKEDAKNAVANAVKAEIKKNPDMSFNEALWKARQRIDDIIEDQFGSSAFDDPLKNSAREASVKAREKVQEFLVDSVSGRDMTTMAKARESVRELIARGIHSESDDLDELVEAVYKQLGGPDIPDPQASKIFAEKMKYLSDLYKVKDNYLAPRLAKEDFGALKRWMKENPGKTSVAKAVIGASIPLGLGAIGVNAVNAGD